MSNVWQPKTTWELKIDTSSVADWRSVGLQPARSAAQLWGERSVVAQTAARGQMEQGWVEIGPPQPGRVQNQTDPWQTTVTMVVLICFYCHLLYRFRREILSCLRNLGHTQDTFLLLDGQGVGFAQFLRSGALLAVLSCAALVMTWLERLTDAAAVEVPIQAEPAGVPVKNFYLFLAALGALGLVVLYRWLALRVMCWFTQTQGIFREVRFLEGVHLSLIALFYAPVAIIIGLSERFFMVGVVLLVGWGIFHVVTLYNYFRLRDFSGVQYFLYLCTIEILPISFLIALAVRGAA